LNRTKVGLKRSLRSSFPGPPKRLNRTKVGLKHAYWPNVVGPPGRFESH